MVKKVKSSKKTGTLKPKKLKASSPKKHGPTAVSKAADPELAAIGKEIRAEHKSTMFKGDMVELSRSKLVKLDEEAREDSLKTYYKNLMLRCIKCDGKFDHEASLPPVEYELKCPHCNESHMLQFTPTSKLFTVHSKTVDLLDTI